LGDGNNITQQLNNVIMGLPREQLKSLRALDIGEFLWLAPDLMEKQHNNSLLRDILRAL